jgi:hypothetical protein
MRLRQKNYDRTALTCQVCDYKLIDVLSISSSMGENSLAGFVNGLIYVFDGENEESYVCCSALCICGVECLLLLVN